MIEILLILIFLINLLSLIFIFQLKIKNLFMIFLYIFNCFMLTNYCFFKENINENIKNKNILYVNISLSVFILIFLLYKFYTLFNKI